MKIYVTKNFIQQPIDSIVFDLPTMVILETATPEAYSAWVVEETEELIASVNEIILSNRTEAYNTLNQFEMQFDDIANGTTTWKDAIDAVKLKYPKVIFVPKTEVIV